MKKKKLEGTARKDRPAPATPPPGVPAMPKWLNAEAKAEWSRIVPQLEALKVLYEVDGSLLADYCSAHSLAVNATKVYQREGLEVRQYGQKQKHPMIKVAQEARAQAKQHIGEFHKRIASRMKEEDADSVLAKAAKASQLNPSQTKPDDTPLFGAGLRVVDGGATAPQMPEVKSG